LKVFDAVTSLAQSICKYVGQRKEAEEAEDVDMDATQPRSWFNNKRNSGYPIEEWKPWLHTIRSCIREHINMPAALASGHRGLHDKVAAELHKWYYVQEGPLKPFPKAWGGLTPPSSSSSAGLSLNPPLLMV
jgi:hypothetical protein